MGNQSAKEQEKDLQPSISRSPIRNRVLTTYSKDDELNLEFCDEEFCFNNELFYLDIISNRRTTVTSIPRSVSEAALNETNSKPAELYGTHENKDEIYNFSESTRNSVSKTPKLSTEAAPKTKLLSTKSRRRNKSRLQRLPIHAEDTTEDCQVPRTDERRRHRKRRNKQTEQYPGLVLDILNTIIKLESTLLDEQKYEQRLRKRLTDQIESIQHLSLSLSTEKDRNKRLMALLNNYDDPEIEEPNVMPLPFSDGQLSKRRDELEKCSKLNSRLCTTAREELSFRNHSSISPLHMEQCYDELSKSYEKCQAELRKKSKLLTLALCKQETLQARCDKLTEEFFKSQKYIETMREKFASRSNQKTRRSKFKKYNSNDFQTEISDKAEQFLEELIDYKKDVSKNLDERLIEGKSLASSIEKLNEKGKEPIELNRSARKTKSE